MKYCVNVYEDYDGLTCVAEGVVGYDDQDWANLISEVLANSQIDTKAVKDIKVDIFGAVFVEGLYELPENPTYLTVRIRTSSGDIIAEFQGIDVCKNDNQSEETVKANERTWRRCLTYAVGYNYDDAIIECLKKKEKREIEAIKERTNLEIEEIENFKKGYTNT